jgi:hypothetical protein
VVGGRRGDAALDLRLLAQQRQPLLGGLRAGALQAARGLVGGGEVL